MTNEQLAYLQGIDEALGILAKLDQTYRIDKTDSLTRKIAKENALVALRAYGNALEDARAQKVVEFSEAAPQEDQPKKKRTKKSPEGLASRRAE